MDLVFLKLDLLRATKTPSRLLSSEVDALRRQYAQALARSRLLEHKHLALAKVHARRVRVTDTSINLWCRRQKWLSMSKSDEVAQHRTPSVAAAQEALLDQTYFALSPAQMAEFEHILNEPLSNNQALADLLASRAPWER